MATRLEAKEYIELVDQQEVEGFIDHHGNFLDRYETYDHALQCGQLSDTTPTSKCERRER